MLNNCSGSDFLEINDSFNNHLKHLNANQKAQKPPLPSGQQERQFQNQGQPSLANQVGSSEISSGTGHIFQGTGSFQNFSGGAQTTKSQEKKRKKSVRFKLYEVKNLKGLSRLRSEKEEEFQGLQSSRMVQSVQQQHQQYDQQHNLESNQFKMGNMGTFRNNSKDFQNPYQEASKGAQGINLNSSPPSLNTGSMEKINLAATQNNFNPFIETIDSKKLQGEINHNRRESTQQIKHTNSLPLNNNQIEPINLTQTDINHLDSIMLDKYSPRQMQLLDRNIDQQQISRKSPALNLSVIEKDTSFDSQPHMMPQIPNKHQIAQTKRMFTSLNNYVQLAQAKQIVWAFDKVKDYNLRQSQILENHYVKYEHSMRRKIFKGYLQGILRAKKMRVAKRKAAIFLERRNLKQVQKIYQFICKYVQFQNKWLQSVKREIQLITIGSSVFEKLLLNMRIEKFRYQRETELKYKVMATIKGQSDCTYQTQHIMDVKYKVNLLKQSFKKLKCYAPLSQQKKYNKGVAERKYAKTLNKRIFKLLKKSVKESIDQRNDKILQMASAAANSKEQDDNTEFFTIQIRKESKYMYPQFGGEGGSGRSGQDAGRDQKLNFQKRSLLNINILESKNQDWRDNKQKLSTDPSSQQWQ